MSDHHRQPPTDVRVERIDHFVLTVADIGATCAFYQRVLHMDVVRFGEGRTALRFGQQKINLHPRGAEAKPNARHAIPGSGDFCLITRTRMDALVRHLEQAGVVVEEGPVPKTGALGPIMSVYFRDPDDNLVEVACYPDA